jgi:hypothetical protein
VDTLAVMGCYYLALKNWRKHVNWFKRKSI